jgi:hypothetical protein
VLSPRSQAAFMRVSVRTRSAGLQIKIIAGRAAS